MKEDIKPWESKPITEESLLRSMDQLADQLDYSCNPPVWVTPSEQKVLTEIQRKIKEK